MKVLIISPGYSVVPAINGGAIETLIDEIVEQNQKNPIVDFEIISINDGIKLKSQTKNCKYHYIDNTKKSYKIFRIIYAIINSIPNVYIGNVYTRKVAKLLKKIDISSFDRVIIENNPKSVLILKKYFNCPVYLHLHNDYLNSKTPKSLQIFENYDKIITVSDFIGDRVRTITKNTENKITTLYNGIDIERFQIKLNKNEKNEIQKKYNISKDDFVFLYTGRIIRLKGVLEMIKSFNIVSKQYPKTKLIIVGSTSFKNGKESPYSKKIDKEIKKNDKNIIMTGFIDNKKIPEIYNICNAQIVPSLWGEALGITAIEGMAAKVPLVINDIGGLPETTGRDGAILLDSKNVEDSLVKAMISIIDNPDLQKKIVSNSQKRLALFDKRIFFQNFINILKKD